MSKIEELINEYCPNGVEYLSINEIATTYHGLSGKNKDDFKNGNSKFITYMNVYKNASTDLSDTSVVKINENENQNNIKLGDILMTTSSENIEDSGMISVVTKQPEENIYLNSFCFGIRIKDEYLSRFNFDYLKHLFRSKAIRKKIQKCSFGVTRFNLNKNKFLKIKIPVPPMEVQSEIVHILDNFTLLTAELTAELTARNKQYEYYRNELIKKCKARDGKLIELLSQPISDGPHTTPQLYSSGIPFVSATAVYNGKVHLEDAKGFISKEFDDECAKKYKPKKNDVYMVKSGSTTGKVAYVDFDADFNIWSPLAAMRTSNVITSRYLYHLLQTTNVQNQVQTRMSHGSQPNLSMRVLEKFDVKIPKINEQERIVNILDRFDALTNDINEGLPAEIEARKKQYEYYRDKLLNFKELKEA